jgi:membrane fusion protein, multidrug efflux system
MKLGEQTAVLLFLALLAGCKGSGEAEAAGKQGGGPGGPGAPSGPEPPAAVTVGDVILKSVPVELRAFGTVEPNATVAIKSQVGGVLVGVHFEKGQDVKKGDLLFTLDARPAKAEKQLTEANLARDKVQFENARKEAERQKGLLDQKLVSEEQYEKATSTAEALAAVMRADQAAIKSAKLKVDYSTIKSPIDGRTGDLMVDLGNLVKAGDVPLVIINQIRPIRVAFSLPQRALPSVMAQMAAGAPRVDAVIPGAEEAPATGKVVLVDNAVDPATGTIKLWAEFENADSRLWPGQLVNVVLTLSVQDDAITVPSRAVQTGQKGSYVFVVRPDATVEDRVITVERTQGDDVIVSEGLAAGERVVTDGQLRLKPGSKIMDKSAAPSGPPKP